MVLTDLPERIRRRINVASNGCWIWDRPNHDGYGQVQWCGKKWKAHRLVYELLIGPHPEGLVTDHLCHTRDKSCPGGAGCVHRRCVNPAHIEHVTRGINASRGERTWRTRCPKGHRYTKANTRIERNKRGTLRHCRECNREATRRWRANRKAA